MKKLVHYFTFQRHSGFMPLRYMYPECAVLIDQHPKIQPLQCYRTACHANRNCADVMAHRVHYLFEEVFSDNVEMLFLYFKLRNRGYRSKGEWISSLAAGVFHRDLREPTWMVLNRWGFAKCMNEGVTMKWLPTDEFLFMGGTKELVVPENRLVLSDD